MFVIVLSIVIVVVVVVVVVVVNVVVVVALSSSFQRTCHYNEHIMNISFSLLSIHVLSINHCTNTSQ